MTALACAQRGENITLTVIRGDPLNLSVGLDETWVDQIANPAGYTMNLVFRDHQDDALVPHLSASSGPLRETLPDDADPSVVVGDFAIPPQDTQALPYWKIVGYCEIVETATGHPMRLFDIQVEMRD